MEHVGELVGHSHEIGGVVKADLCPTSPSLRASSANPLPPIL